MASISSGISLQPYEAQALDGELEKHVFTILMAYMETRLKASEFYTQIYSQVFDR